MIAHLLGVLNDGSDLAPTVPANPARELRLALGQDLTIRLSVVTPSGKEVSLAGASVVLSARRKAAWPAMFLRRTRGEGACSCRRPGCSGCSQPRYGSDARRGRISTPDLSVTGTPPPTPEARNRIDLVVLGSATKPLEPGRFAYDVWLTLGGLRDQIVPTSPLVLEPAVTFPP